MELPTTHVNCNLCGADRADILFPAGWAQKNQIVKCRQCGFMYANPRRGDLDHQIAARSDPDFLEEMLRREHDSRMEKERLQVRDYACTREWLQTRFPRRGALVEVGCGLGFLLKYFTADGWIGTGLEPDPLCCAHAQRTLGLSVEAGALPGAALATASVDVVLMMHVIEHVDDAKVALRDIYRVLKPGGVLVLETPRYDTAIFKLLGHRERSLACDGHIYFFTSATLCSMLRATGFAVVRHDYVGRSLTLDRLLWNVGVVSRVMKFRRLLERLSHWLNLSRFPLAINLRDMQRVYAVKSVEGV